MSLSDVVVMYNDGKLRMVYNHEANALIDKDILERKGYKNIRLQRVQVQYQPREGEPLSIEDIEALKRCVERS